MDVERLSRLLREAEDHHGEYEPTAPPHHWSGWYAAYIVARERGESVEQAVAAGAARIETELQVEAEPRVETQADGVRS